MQLRRLGPGDEARLWTLRARALRESPQAFATDPAEHPSLEDYRAAMADRWRDPGQRVLGALDGEALIAMVVVGREPRLKTRHRAGIYGLYVAPEARRAGLGRRLLAAAVTEARELGAAQLELAVTADNRAAIELYRSAGFRSWGVQPRALRLDGRYLDEMWMVLELEPRPGGADGAAP